MHIDLNGFCSIRAFTVESGATVYLKDNATDDFAGSFGYLVGVNGAVKAEEGYLLYKDESGYVSAHAYTLAVSNAVLRPGAAGIYFSGSFNIHAGVPVVRKGIVLSVYSPQPVADGSDAGCLWSNGETSVLVKDILSVNVSDGENAMRAIKPIYARAYMELSGGTILYSDTVIVNLVEVVQAVDRSWGLLTNRQKDTLGAMYETFKTPMYAWEIPNLKRENP